MKVYSYFDLKWFKFFLLSYLILIIGYNLYAFIVDFPNGWLPILLHTFILLLVLSKNKNLKIILRTWSMIFLIIFPSIQLLSRVIKKSLNDSFIVDFSSSLMAVFFLVVGVIIFIYSESITLK
jgi:hypothetical protein